MKPTLFALIVIAGATPLLAEVPEAPKSEVEPASTVLPRLEDAAQRAEAWLKDHEGLSSLDEQPTVNVRYGSGKLQMTVTNSTHTDLRYWGHTPVRPAYVMDCYSYRTSRWYPNVSTLEGGDGMTLYELNMGKSVTFEIALDYVPEKNPARLRLYVPFRAISKEGSAGQASLVLVGQYPIAPEAPKSDAASTEEPAALADFVLIPPEDVVRRTNEWLKKERSGWSALDEQPTVTERYDVEKSVFRMTVTNSTHADLSYGGYTPTKPTYLVDGYDDTAGWRPTITAQDCGNGLASYSLKMGQSVTFEVELGRNPGKLRFYLPFKVSDKEGSTIKKMSLVLVGEFPIP